MSFPGTSQEECRERSQRQPKPGSLVGTKKLLLFNKRKEETAHFQSVVSNLEFGDLAGWAVPTTQDRNTRDPGLPVRRLRRSARSSGTAKGARSGHPVPRLRRCARKYAGQEQQLPRRMGASFPGTSQEECRERSQRQPKPGSLVGTKKLLLFNKRKEDIAHFQGIVTNLEF